MNADTLRPLWCADLPDEAATTALGASIAQALIATGQGLCIYLQGNLGMGKTTLCRGLLRALGQTGAVKSPTFTLVEPYENVLLPVYHFDLYRLLDAEELEFMGIRDYFGRDTLCLVEWPEKGAGVLPGPDCQIELSVQGAGRAVQVWAESPRGTRLLQALVPILAASGFH